MPKEAKKTGAGCSFCDRLPSKHHTTLWRKDRSFAEGPRICETCINEALRLLREDNEHHACDIYVSTSKVHGRGVFAGKRILKGSYVGTYEGVDNGEVTRSNEPYVIFSYDDDDEEAHSWRIGTNEFRFLNHSDDANLEMDEDYHFWATRTIKRDEELTWYYGPEFSAKVAKAKRRKAKVRR